MKIVSESRVVENVAYSLYFAWATEPSSGFSFPCDENGNVAVDKLSAIGRTNLSQCVEGEGTKFEPRVVEKREWSYREPVVGRCECGREVALEGFTNTCDCGRDYNRSGQLLASRECWGEETGEPWYECY